MTPMKATAAQHVRIVEHLMEYAGIGRNRAEFLAIEAWAAVEPIISDASASALATVTRERDEARRSHQQEMLWRAAALQEYDALRTATAATMRLVLEQAEDPGLWFIGDKTAPEAYLQAALRRLHAAVEAITTRGEAAGGVEAEASTPVDEASLPVRRDKSATSIALDQLDAAERIVRKRDAEVGALMSQISAMVSIETVEHLLEDACLHGPDQPAPSARLVRAYVMAHLQHRDKRADGACPGCHAFADAVEAGSVEADCTCGTNAQHAPDCPASPGAAPPAAPGTAPPFTFSGVCSVCGELMAGEGKRHKGCETGAGKAGDE